MTEAAKPDVPESARGQAFDAELARASAWLLLVYELAGLVLVVLLHLLHVPSPWEELAAALLTFGAAALWAVRALPTGNFSLRELAGPMPRGAAWGLVLVVVLNNLTLSVGLYGFSHLTEIQIVDVDGMELGPSVREAGLVGRALFLLIVAVVAAPLVEELVFRGVLFRKWRYEHGPIAALVLTSAVFSALHPGRQLNMAILGAQLVLLYTSTRTLWAPVLAHLINNGVGVAGLIATSAVAPEPDGPGLTATVIALALGTTGVAWFVHATRRTLRDPLPPFARPALDPTALDPTARED